VPVDLTKCPIKYQFIDQYSLLKVQQSSSEQKSFNHPSDVIVKTTMERANWSLYKFTLTTDERYSPQNYSFWSLEFAQWGDCATRRWHEVDQRLILLPTPAPSTSSATSTHQSPSINHSLTDQPAKRLLLHSLLCLSFGSPNNNAAVI